MTAIPSARVIIPAVGLGLLAAAAVAFLMRPLGPAGLVATAGAFAGVALLAGWRYFRDAAPGNASRFSAFAAVVLLAVLAGGLFSLALLVLLR